MHIPSVLPAFDLLGGHVRALAFPWTPVLSDISDPCTVNRHIPDILTPPIGNAAKRQTTSSLHIFKQNSASLAIFNIPSGGMEHWHGRMWAARSGLAPVLRIHAALTLFITLCLTPNQCSASSVCDVFGPRGDCGTFKHCGGLSSMTSGLPARTQCFSLMQM